MNPDTPTTDDFRVLVVADNRTAAMAAAMLMAAQGAHALQINVTYDNGAGETWTAGRTAVIEQTIADWEAEILNNQTVDVTVTFKAAGAGSYLGNWQGTGSFSLGTDIFPWTSGISHTVRFNADRMDTGLSHQLWWDSTPETADDIPQPHWDALSVARHEFGHMMGFTDGLYVDNFARGTEVNRWTTHVDVRTFDTGGLNVLLDEVAGNPGIFDLSHLENVGAGTDDLMTAALFNGSRNEISMLDTQMLELAHDYTLRSIDPGDANRDGSVDDDDLSLLLAHWDDDGPWEWGNFNYDGTTNDDDLSLLLANWDGGGAAVPEPSAVMLILAGTAVLARRRRRS